MRQYEISVFMRQDGFCHSHLSIILMKEIEIF